MPANAGLHTNPSDWINNLFNEAYFTTWSDDNIAMKHSQLLVRSKACCFFWIKIAFSIGRKFRFIFHVPSGTLHWKKPNLSIRLFSGRGRRTWSRLPARSVLLPMAEVSTGDPHPTARSACLGFSLFILSKDKKDTERCLWRNNRGGALHVTRRSRNVIIFVRKCM